MENLEFASAENVSNSTHLTLRIVDVLFKRSKNKETVTGEEIRQIIDQLSPEQRSQVIASGKLPVNVKIAFNDEKPRKMTDKERLLYQQHLLYKLTKK